MVRKNIFFLAFCLSLSNYIVSDVNFSLTLSYLSNALSGLQLAELDTDKISTLSTQIASLQAAIPSQVQASLSLDQSVVVVNSLSNTLLTITNMDTISQNSVNVATNISKTIASTALNIGNDSSATADQLITSAQQLSQVSGIINDLISNDVENSDTSFNTQSFMAVSNCADTMLQTSTTLLANPQANAQVSLATAQMLESWMNMMNPFIYGFVNYALYTSHASIPSAAYLATYLQTFSHFIVPSAFNLSDQGLIQPLINAYSAIFTAYEYLVRSNFFSMRSLFLSIAQIGQSFGDLVTSSLFTEQATDSDINAVRRFLQNQLHNYLLGYVQLFELAVTDNSDVIANQAFNTLLSNPTIANAQAAAHAFAVYTNSLSVLAGN